MKKHAYLIIAHNNFEMLKLLIEKLDHEKNDLYIHIDKKVRHFDEMKINKKIELSRVFFIKDRINVNWGGKSQIDVEMNLLQEAKRGEYAYYHLISGVDFPIKSQEYIHKFFEENNGREFIGISKSSHEKVEERMKYYYILRDIKFIKRNKLVNKIIYILDRISVLIQKLFGINRLKNINFNIYKGCNWFSITHECVEYICSKKEEINKIYKYSYCCDEVFLQTIIMNSNFKLYDLYDEFNGCKREIDWERGKPYIFRKDDIDYLRDSDKLFARKFDYRIDNEILKTLYELN